jgi:hypothetical protein
MKYAVHVVYRERYEYDDVSNVEAIDIAKACVADNHGYPFLENCKFYVIGISDEEAFIPPYGDLSDAGMDGA